MSWYEVHCSLPVSSVQSTVLSDKQDVMIILAYVGSIVEDTVVAHLEPHVENT